MTTGLDDAARRPLLLVHVACLLEGVYLCSGSRLCGDLAAAVLLAGIAGRPRRGMLLAAFLVAFQCTFPPLTWPLYLVCFVPLFGLWRYGEKGPLPWWIEALAVGFLVTWLAAPFLAAGVGRHGAILQVVGGLLFGLQLMGLAAAVRLTRAWRPLPAAGVVALTAGGAEFLRVFLFDCPILMLALPAASTPLAQLARPLTLFGVSGFLCLINFLLIPDLTQAGWRRWAPPVTALFLWGIACEVGTLLRLQVDASPLPFTAFLVQPRVPADVARNGLGSAAETQLLALTAAALDQNGTPDLIVWPETVIHGTVPPLHYATNLLFGAFVAGSEHTAYNSGCLLQPNGTLSRHDKLKLIPFAEALPPWLRANRLGAWLLDFFRVRAPFTPGKSYQPLVLHTANGEVRRLAVSLCFEMHLPWLPQYRSSQPVDAVVHLTDESWFRGYPGHPQLGTWACQYRAIETRTWGLVCAAWAHTALIDPTGKVVALLKDEPGVLDTTPWSFQHPTAYSVHGKDVLP